ncbi:inter-alpha-trypsin inhibitor heavy chain H5-like [Podargus strigoides]
MKLKIGVLELKISSDANKNRVYLQGNTLTQVNLCGFFFYKFTQLLFESRYLTISSESGCPTEAEKPQQSHNQRIMVDVECRRGGALAPGILNGYFMHYFTPTNLPPLPKNAVFVLDSSASMVGTKLKQVRRDSENTSSLPMNLPEEKSERKLLTQVQLEGTNISGALQTGAKLLNDYIAQNDIDARSVFLIIFLTDGRPTVGETQLSKILSNTKDVIRDKFCLFTIGIGNDVDHKLLERMAQENCGMTRHFQEDEDAASHLKGFYDEIGTPLLSDIHVDYPEDNVEQVTQNFFPNYFNGSEIIIAGKLINRTSDSLHVEVTASNSKKYILFKTDVAIDYSSRNDIRGIPGLEDGKGDKNYIERARSYLTIKELLNSQLKSDNNQEKDYLMEKSKSMALTSYNFVTPFTVLKTREAGLHSEPPQEEFFSPSTDGIGEKLQSLQGHKAPSGIRRQQDKQRIKISRTSADGDPHFVIDFPSSKFSVCFNIDGEPGDILRLVSDHKESGEQPSKAVACGGKLKCKASSLAIRITSKVLHSNKPERSYLEITPKRIILDDGERLLLSCDRSAVVRSSSLEVSISANSNVTVTIRDTTSFVILIHHYKNPAPYQRNHLGFYITNSKGLSSDSYGLLAKETYFFRGLKRTMIKSNFPAI